MEESTSLTLGLCFHVTVRFKTASCQILPHGNVLNCNRRVFLNTRTVEYAHKSLVAFTDTLCTHQIIQKALHYDRHVHRTL